MIAINLQNLLDQRGVSRTDVIKKHGMKRHAIYRHLSTEEGKHRTPNLKSLLVYAKALNMSVDALCHELGIDPASTN